MKTSYRAAVIGLGWMGLLYDLAGRIGDRFEIDDPSLVWDLNTPEQYEQALDAGL